MGDIEAMFYQVKVPRSQHDYMRFLWWPNGDFNQVAEEYRMSVHIFGAASSPSVSNYALQKAADIAGPNFDASVLKSIKKNFYVDDFLKSVDEEEIAIRLLKDVTSACKFGGFRLTKFTSNSKKVIQTVPFEDRSKEVQAMPLDNVTSNCFLTERALGVKWDVIKDELGFSFSMTEKPVTRRGILSMISSVYDPLGFIAPLLLPAKKILQDLCKEKVDWDEEIPNEFCEKWFHWYSKLKEIEDFGIQRCYMPTSTEMTDTEIHMFSDASATGYGVVGYLRRRYSEKEVQTSFIIGKARLAPLKTTTIPKLELSAATVSVKVAQSLLKELEINIQSVFYYTDSTTVLHYIRSKKKRFPVFVANRVSLIHEYSDEKQWHYIDTKNNPADCASRGVMSFTQLKDGPWIHGPSFLRDSTLVQQTEPKSEQEIEEECPQQEMSILTTASHEIPNPTKRLLEHYSSWYRLKRAVALYRKFFIFLRLKEKPCRTMMVEDLDQAETAILRFTQCKFFPKEVNHLYSGSVHNENEKQGRVKSSVPKSSTVYRLDPFLAKCDGLLRVGGRLRRSTLPEPMKHPVLLPKNCHVTSLIVLDAHIKLGHAGRNHVISKLREQYWVINVNATVRKIIGKCVKCKRINARVGEQKMADLPADRIEPGPPFSFTGVDFFGPFNIREGRKELKRYGVIYTCLVSRAVHMETAKSLSTDSFINSLRRFLSRRGNVKEIRCDNGTNFVGASNVFKDALNEMEKEKVQAFLLKGNIDWKFNVPAASHTGGVWERQIRSVRKVLHGLMANHSHRLDEEELRTLMCEVEAIVNSRPLSCASTDIDDFQPLSPSNLLTLKQTPVVPPPGNFQEQDIYMRQRWRRVQHLANEFWKRWSKEYLLNLQPRPKWNKEKRNQVVGDIVIIKDENLPRSDWKLGRVIETYADDQGIVRSANVKTQSTELKRPVSKLVLMLPKE